ncbi:MAG TPA: class I SAM-dependent methyltransferase [bacterium]|nr:class I SAM-dependent methyltransferase [bacterium]
MDANDVITPPCPSCGSTERAVVLTAPPFGVAGCCRCGLQYTAPRYSDAAQRAFYQRAYDPDYFAWYDRALVPTLRQRYALALARLGEPDGALLDVGAFTGVFVAQACAAGWAARGVEPLAGAVTLARQRDIPVARGELLAAAVADGTLAVVTLWDVLEHLPEPRTALARIARWLRPGGRLLIRVPDFEACRAAAPAAFADEYRRWLYPLDLNQHLLHFTEDDLRRLLADAGFGRVQVWDDGLLEPVRGTQWERWARAITAWGARRRGLRREMTVLAQLDAAAVRNAGDSPCAG